MTDGCMSISLYHKSPGTTTATFEVTILDKFGKSKKENTAASSTREFNGIHNNWGWKNFIKRSDILDPSNNILCDDGTLAVVISMKEEGPTVATVFVPKNPLVNMVQSMFLDEETADVLFEDGSKRGKSYVTFHAQLDSEEVCTHACSSLT